VVRYLIYEPRLEELISKNKSSGSIIFNSDSGSGIRQSDIIFVCVGTPPNPSGHSDLTAMMK